MASLKSLIRNTKLAWSVAIVGVAGGIVVSVIFGSAFIHAKAENEHTENMLDFLRAKCEQRILYYHDGY